MQVLRMMASDKASPPSSCDTFVALPPATSNGQVIFGKNSDRPGLEVQEVVYIPEMDHSPGCKVQCTYIEMDQVPHTHAVILSKPSWMWGAEMGSNDQGVCIGNEAVWTKLNGPEDLNEKLLGMDILRLALERASSASEAVDIIGQLLDSPGQGGPCSEEPGQQAWSYHNSFLIADGMNAWVLETAGKYWAAEHITEGVRNISNELTIGTKIDRCSPNLEEEARKLGLYTESMGPFNFSAVFSESGKVPENRMSFRYRHGLKMLKDLSASGKFGVRDMFKILRDEESGICMTDGGFVSTGSQVSVLSPQGSPSPCCHWFTATPNPLTSIYKPFIFTSKAAIGTSTLSPDFGEEDPARKSPRFQSQVDRRHALYRGHETLRDMLGREDPKGMALLENLRELEEKCVEDMEETLICWQEENAAKVAHIFQHMANLELNFYK
ncbi:secernin-2-like isoform X3 [Pomacea canaliculata]|uniref:secernin-2-like isoform X3 n=1 Tax=Pomacea canaliculata TaxID=400727 RepID=UPI000D73CD68|nr:secernin-2-like isoform X3 [Pomacea canaliculata]